MKKTVVIISYYFPPFPAVGGLRVRGMAKYLARYGWDVIVITPNLGIQPDREFKIIQTKKRSILINPPKQGDNTPTLPPKRPSILGYIYELISNNEVLSSLIMDLLALVDYTLLRKEFLDIFEKIHRKRKINAIISTSPPEVTHMIAREISQKYNIPWIVEYRDLWSLNPVPKWRNIKIGKMISQAIEIRVTQYANEVVVINEALKKNEQNLIKDKPIVIIKNGFDPEETLEITKKKQEENKFIITYTGSFYKSKRNPLPIARAIDELIKDNIIPKEQIQLNLFGSNISKEILKKLQEFEFINTGIVSREEAREQQKYSDALLLILAEEDNQSLPAKLFEYLSTHKPILAVGPSENKMIREILDKTGLGIFILSTNIDSLKNTIISFYNHDIMIKPKKDVIMQYSQKEMAKKMNKVLVKLFKRDDFREGA